MKGNSTGGMESILQISHNSRASFHFERSRLNHLFTEAARYPLVLVYAGAGYGKTTAVRDFVEEYQARTIWVQLSERDNVGARYWENFCHIAEQINSSFAKEVRKIEFPDTVDKINQYLGLVHHFADLNKQIFVLDDFHVLEEPSVIRFIERTIYSLPVQTSVFLVSRSTPHINTAGMISKGCLFSISENDLRFTGDELAQYFRKSGIFAQPENLREIMHDTKGWAFAINLIARSYQKAPGYGGYLRNAMKTNIFRLMETEVWDEISWRMQCFLVSLSLIGHLSFDLIELLTEGDEELIAGFERQNDYVRRDGYINAYIIHPLFLEFLATKQGLLPEEQKRKTYIIAGDWCNKNGFKIDAMSYYEKTGDYASIVSIFFELPAQIPYNIAKYAETIIERAPPEIFDTVDYFAVMHLRSCMSQGHWQKSMKLAEYYEAKFLSLPEGDAFREHALCGLYYYWAYLRGLMCVTEDNCDFDLYLEKFRKYISPSFDRSKLTNYYMGPWISIVGSSKKGAPQEYISALKRSVGIISPYFNGFINGHENLGQGELKFYQGDLLASEADIIYAMELARESGQFELVHRALIYMLRLGIAQGDYAKVEQALKSVKAQLDEGRYTNRYINYDIFLSWYYCLLGIPKNVSDWLKQNFSPYSHPGFIENFANQVKARFCYATRRYPPLLAYIQEMKQRESCLYGRVEMLAIEACVYYKMNNKKKALSVLLEAYEAASPNELVMPFIELGKDMRTLSFFATKELDHAGIPKPWLENIYRKAASYAKRQAHVILKYKLANRIVGGVTLSNREIEIITDLSHGLTRAEIASSRNLSINTVKMVINMIYTKMGAENLPDLIRIAAEQKMI